MVIIPRFSDQDIEKMRKELIQNQIDFSSENYIDNEAYKRIENEIVYLGDNIRVTKGAIIYKKFIPDSVKEKINGIYSLGYDGYDHPEKYTLDELCNYIVKDVLPENDRDKDIKVYFERNKTGGNSDGKNGLIRRLYDWGIDIEKYNKIDAIKLLYYFFYIEKIAFNEKRKSQKESERRKEDTKVEKPIISENRNIKTNDFEITDRINIFQMLSNPTLENIYISDRKTRNGEIMFQLKNNMYLEVPLQKMHNYNFYLIRSIFRIDEVIRKSYKFIETTPSELVVRRLEQLPPLMELKKYPDNFIDLIPDLFSDVYYKLIQHENLSITTDILNLSIDDVLKELPGNQRFEKMITNNDILKDNAYNYLKKNRILFAKIVFESDKIDSNQYKKYDKAVEIIDEVIALLNLHTDYAKCKRIPEKLLLTILQCYIFIDKARSIGNAFYHHKSADKKSLYEEMKSGTAALEKNQLAIITLVIDTYYKKCGHTAITELYKFHNYADNTINVLLSCDNSHQMLSTMANALPYLNGFLIEPERMVEIIEYINSRLIYKYTVNVKEDISNRFIAIVDTGELVLSLTEQINQAIYESKSSDTIELSIFDDVLNILCYYGFKIDICSDCKQVNLTDVVFDRITYLVRDYPMK